MNLRYDLNKIMGIALCLLFLSCKVSVIDHRKEVLPSSQTYFLKMSIPDQKVLLEKSKEIVLGMCYHEVVRKLGDPDYETILREKKRGLPIKGTLIRYYLEELHEDTVNENYDKSITYIFDVQKRLIIIRSENINFTDFFECEK